MENFIKKVGEMDLKVTNEKINQVQRNAIKSEFIDALVGMFAEQGIELHKTTEGLVLKIEGKEHDIHIALDPVVKNLDFDLVNSIDELSAKITARQERQEALALAKEKRLAEKQKKTKAEQFSSRPQGWVFPFCGCRGQVYVVDKSTTFNLTIAFYFLYDIIKQ